MQWSGDTILDDESAHRIDHALGLSRIGAHGADADARLQRGTKVTGFSGGVYTLRSRQCFWRQGIVSHSMECQTGRGESPIMMSHA